jgi:hypothetical protein
VKYADVDPELNLRLIAERLGWPDGALEACTAIAAAHPAWTSVYWGVGPVGRPPQPGYRATLRMHDERGHREVELYAQDPAELAERMADVDRQAMVWPAHLTPLTPPR